MKRTCSTLPALLNLVGSDWSRLAVCAELLCVACPTTKITFTRVSGAGVTPKVFEFKIVMYDGRVFKQDLSFDLLYRPKIVFHTNDYWLRSELDPAANLLDCLVSLVAAYDTLEKITYDFT